MVRGPSGFLSHLTSVSQTLYLGLGLGNPNNQSNVQSVKLQNFEDKIADSVSASDLTRASSLLSMAFCYACFLVDG